MAVSFVFPPGRRTLVALVASLFVPAGALSAQEPEEIELPQVVILGPATPGEELDLEAAQRRGAHGIADLISSSTAAGSVSGSERGQTSLQIRGFDQRQIALELDGVELNLPYDGGFDVGLLGLGLLEGATLMGGSQPGASQSGALGGALQLRGYSPPDSPAFLARLTGQWPWGAGALLRGGSTMGNLDWGGGLETAWRTATPMPGAPPKGISDRDGNGAIRDNSDLLSLAGRLHLAYHWSRRQRSWAIWHGVRSEAGAPPDLRSVNPRYWRWTDNSLDMVQVGHSSQWPTGWSTKVWAYALYPRNTLKAFDDDGYDSQLGASAFTSTYNERRFGLRTVVAWKPQSASPFAPEKVEARVGFRHDRHSSQGTPATDGQELWETRLESLLGSSFDLGGGFSMGGVAGGFFVFPGAATQGGSNTAAFTPGLWTRWEGATLALALNVSRRVRFPTLKERFSGLEQFMVPNPGLAHEVAWNGSMELRWTPSETLEAGAELHASHVSDLIFSTSVGNGQLMLDNSKEARIVGTAAWIRSSPFAWLGLWAKGAWLDARSTVEPGYLPNRPAWRGHLGTEIEPLKALKVGSQITLEGPQHYQDRQTQLWGTLGHYALLDAWASWHHKGWAFFLQASNLTNAWHEPSWGFPGPGRWFQSGVEYSF